LSEIVVGLTDYLLTLECALFAGWLARADASSPAIRRFFCVFFLSLTTTSLTGGTYHVWFSESSSLVATVLWKATVVALGATAFAVWAVGAYILLKGSLRERAVQVAGLEYLAYAAYTVIVDDRFSVAIANYVPAVICLGIALAVRYRRHPTVPVLGGLAGLIVTGIAAVIQRSGMGLHPDYFNHNATYHLVQAVGFALIFYAALFLVRTPLHGGTQP
jgi:hypothetical protein